MVDSLESNIEWYYWRMTAKVVWVAEYIGIVRMRNRENRIK